MKIPNTATVVDFLYGVICAHSIDDIITDKQTFDDQRNIFNFKYDQIINNFSDKTSLEPNLISENLNFIINILQDINYEKTPLSIKNKYENKYILINCLYLPFIISVLRNLHSDSKNNLILCHLQCFILEIIEGSKDVTSAMENEYRKDVDRFVATKILQVLPRNVAVDWKKMISGGNGGKKQINFYGYDNELLLNDIKISINDKNKFHNIESTILACGLLCKSMENINFEFIDSSLFNESLVIVDELIKVEFNPEYYNVELKVKNKRLKYLRYIQSNFIKEHHHNQLERHYALSRAVEVIGEAAFYHDIKYILLVIHEMMGKTFSLPEFTTTLFDEFEREEKKLSDEDYINFLSETHKVAFKEFYKFLLNISNEGGNGKEVLQLSCIVLTLCFYNFRVVRGNEMSRLLSLIRSNLPSYGRHLKVIFFYTPFFKNRINRIDTERYSENSQIILYAFNYYNMLLRDYSHGENIIYEKMISPFLDIQMDKELEIFLDSIDGKDYDRDSARKLKQKRPFWRIDKSDIYEVLRDIDFYIRTCGSENGYKNITLTLGLTKYYNLSNKQKLNVLKILNKKMYEHDLSNSISI